MLSFFHEVFGYTCSCWDNCEFLAVLFYRYFFADYCSSRRYCQPLSSTSVLPSTVLSTFLQIAIIILAVTHGLQVSSLFNCSMYNLTCRLGDHLYHQERIHTHRLDGCLSYSVRHFKLCRRSMSDCSIRYPVYSFFLPIYSFRFMDKFVGG
jgi:hypothetical protein